jgi:hypothetical protein
MSRSSARGQTEPLAALVAVAAVCLALSLYAGLVAERLPRPAGPDAEPVLERAVDDIAPDGVAAPERLDAIDESRPRRNVSLAVANDSWTVGPTPPPDANTARRPVPVKRAPGRVIAGRLRVSVW